MTKKPATKRGRPSLTAGEAIRRVLITLDSQSIERAKKLGAGNVSAGIRQALAKRSTS